MTDGRDNKGRFSKGNPGKQKGTRNKANLALSQAIVAGASTTPLAVMLEAMVHYRRQWLKLEDGPDRRFAAELMLSAARQAAPYVHPRKLIVEEEHAPVVNVIDKREMGRMLTINGSTNGHGGNGHGGNGSNGHGGNGGNGHGGNGHGSNGGGDASLN